MFHDKFRVSVHILHERFRDYYSLPFAILTPKQLLLLDGFDAQSLHVQLGQEICGMHRLR
jgi:hypothetical protein